MKLNGAGELVFSPSDLVHYIESPFASWMDRYDHENPGVLSRDETSEDDRLIAETGERHEQSVLEDFRTAGAALVEISREDPATAVLKTITAIEQGVPLIYQAALQSGRFAGFADFLILDAAGHYQVWDTKLARSPKPYYAIQLCCYSEMFSEMCGVPLPERFGIILGTKDRVEYRTEDFIYYYRHIKQCFLELQDGFSGRLEDRPEPLPGGDYRPWESCAEAFFTATDHLVRVAGITTSQIKKLNKAEIRTMTSLSLSSEAKVPKLAPDTMTKLAAQARLQCLTNDERTGRPEALPHYEALAEYGPNGEPVGIATLPPPHPADVAFDMEGFPLAPGGLEYLFGVAVRKAESEGYDYLE